MLRQAPNYPDGIPTTFDSQEKKEREVLLCIYPVYRNKPFADQPKSDPKQMWSAPAPQKPVSSPHLSMTRDVLTAMANVPERLRGMPKTYTNAT